MKGRIYKDVKEVLS